MLAAFLVQMARQDGRRDLVEDLSATVAGSLIMVSGAAWCATPLHSVHTRLGASFTDFGGWRMPLRYASDIAEHRAVRSSAGIFDLSHMGEIGVSGPGAVQYARGEPQVRVRQR